MTGRLVPDYKTIADFRKDNGPAFRKVCAQFVALCRRLELFADASVAIDGSKFKAVTLTFGEESVRGQATASDQDRIRCQPPIVLPWSVTGGRQLANLGSNRSNETDTGRISLFIFGSIRELYALVIECLERQEVGLWTARVSRCGFRRRAG